LEKLDKNRTFRLYLIFELPNKCCSNIFSFVLALFCKCSDIKDIGLRKISKYYMNLLNCWSEFLSLNKINTKENILEQHIFCKWIAFSIFLINVVWFEHEK
jgi:hypothetical protein